MSQNLEMWPIHIIQFYILKIVITFFPITGTQKIEYIIIYCLRKLARMFRNLNMFFIQDHGNFSFENGNVLIGICQKIKYTIISLTPITT